MSDKMVDDDDEEEDIKNDWHWGDENCKMKWNDDVFDDAHMVKFREISRKIIEMGLIDIWRDMFMDVLINKMEEVTTKECENNFDKKILDRLLRWMVPGPLLWLRTALGLPRQAPLEEPEDEKSMEYEWWRLVLLLMCHLIDHFQQVRIREGFDMVRDFPDSSPGLRDLRTCLMLRGGHGGESKKQFVAALREQFSRRLLIPGANTKSVIAVYIKTIKALRLVDPRGVLLEAISGPIKEYLKSRKDTIRCIVTALTEDSDLQHELGDVAGKGGEFVDFDFDSDDSYDSDPENWEPEPIDADPLKPTKKHQDIIIMLIGIYGSKEMFIKEYREMLAGRLLSTATYATDKEARNLELLKTRFGEQSLGQCEVMLQDIKDSKRLNTNIQNRRGKPKAPTPGRATMAAATASPGRVPFVQDFIPFGQGQSLRPGAPSPSASAMVCPPVITNQENTEPVAEEPAKHDLVPLQALILSRYFWPTSLQDDSQKFNLPPKIQESLEEYESRYKEIKASRKLTWRKGKF